MIRKTRVFALLAVVLPSLAACQLLDALQANTVAVAVLTRTPDLSGAVGLDDETLKTALAGPLADVEQSATAVLVAVGTRDNPTSTSAPNPLTGLEVFLGWGDTRIALCEAGGQSAAGSYTATSLPDGDCSDATLAYVAGEKYSVDVTLEDGTGTVSVVAPEAINPDNVVFSPSIAPASVNGGLLMAPAHSLDAALEVDWSDDPQASQRPAVLTVFRVAYTGAAGEPVSPDKLQPTTEPIFYEPELTPEKLIDIVLLQNYQTTATIPGTVFDTKGIYFVVLTSTELSINTKDLALGSGAMAGHGTAFVMWVE